MSTATRIAAFLVFLFAVANAYSKYGRTCKDIGCLSTEQCVMNEDPCNGYERDSCGRYPTCKKLNNGGSGGDCSTKNCPPGTQCITENGALICKNPTPGLAYDGQRPPVPQDPGSRNYANSNPYANANAPSLQDILHSSSPSSNYPPYPNNNNNNNNNNGYPAYPSNNGYPPYPNNNNNNNGYPPYSNSRPGVDQYGYPVYPPVTPRPVGHNYNNQLGMPQHSPGWGNSNSIYRRNGAVSSSEVSATLLASAITLLCARIFTA